MNPFDRFTKEAKIALEFAENFANEHWSKVIWSEHLLLWIASIPWRLPFNILLSLWIDFEILRNTVLKFNFWYRSVVNWKITVYLTKIIEDAVRFAARNKQTFVWNEHLLYAICSNMKSASYVVLNELEIDIDEMKKIITKNILLVDPKNTQNQQDPKVWKPFQDLFSAVQWVFAWVWWKSWGSMVIWTIWWWEIPWWDQNKKWWAAEFKSKTPTLDFFADDYTKMAKEWKIDPIIWREKEIERVVNILNRKTKNSPVLIWEAWVWKTAIAEWLAIKIQNWKVPFSLVNKRVLSLDLWDLIAWTTFRWEFEERIKEVINEASSWENDIILFIDEIHTLVWLWSSEWSLDAANILKPALARWLIQVVWATTLDEYRTRIEKDKALDRRFQKVIVDEPNHKQTLDILKWLKPSFENYHNVKITNEAIESAISLSQRYIPERFLPDKAIDLLDESCAKKWNFLSPEILEKKKVFEKRLSEIQKEKKKSVDWQDFQKWLKLKNEEERINAEIDELILWHKVEKSKIPTIWKQDVVEAVALATWIESLKNSHDDNKKIIKLWKELWKNIIWQDDILEKISKTILRNRAWVSSPNRPVWSFLLLWPTWVWKTETVKILAKELFDSKDALIKIDMSEFWEKHNVSRLIWASAWYIWHEDWGQLTEAVRKKPYSIVLFDEIEKAHPESYNILLQILEDWHLTDWKWRKINFKNTIIVMTSNLWAETLTQEARQIWFETDEKDELKEAQENFEEKKAMVLEEIKDYFLPELLNRIDKILVYNPLDKKAIKKIVKLQLDELEDRIKDQNLSLDYSKNIIDKLANISYDANSWARKVRRVIQDKIEEKLSEKIISWEIVKWNVAKIIMKKGWKKWDEAEFEVVKKI